VKTWGQVPHALNQPKTNSAKHDRLENPSLKSPPPFAKGGRGDFWENFSED
jgi:hypothetical protein